MLCCGSGVAGLVACKPNGLGCEESFSSEVNKWKEAYDSADPMRCHLTILNDLKPLHIGRDINVVVAFSISSHGRWPGAWKTSARLPKV